MKRNVTFSDEDTDMMTMDTMALHHVQPYLRCLKGPYVGCDIRIPNTGMLIGRDPVACQMLLPDELSVSRYHCRISYQAQTGFFIVTDLHSTNGTFTENGRRLASGGKMALSVGQSFSLCDGKYVFQMALHPDFC